MKKLYCLLFVCIAILVGCNANQMVKIEDENNYQWQQYMNEEEYEQLDKGLTYMEVVKIAGGEGELQKEDIYRWPDELLLTQAYDITFENGKLVSKEIIQLKGASNRTESQKEKIPAKRE